MTAQDLKNSILQQAIQGKLLPQNPSDEPASELLKKISAERQKLIDEGKIKNPPQLPPITDDEKPFDIPENWKWVRLGEIFNVRSSKRIHQSDWQSSGVPFLRGRELVQLSKFGKCDTNIYISQNLYQKLKNFGVPVRGDILVSAVGTIGKAYAVTGARSFYYKDAYVLCFENFGDLFPQFMKYAIESPPVQRQIHEDAMASTVKQLTIEKSKSIVFPLPPLAEQKRIVEKLEEILPLVERYGELEQRLTKLDKEFPDKLKKSLLQQAIQGKLTEQLTTDGDAKDLLEKIRAEKSKLISEGKIKKEKPLPPISAEEIPFDIPENWTWARIRDIAEVITGSTPSKKRSDYYGGIFPFFKPADLNYSRHVFKASEYLSEKGKQVSKIIPINSIGVCCIGTIGKCGYFEVECTTNQQINSVVPKIYPLYVYYYFLSNEFINDLLNKSSATTISIVNKSKMESCKIPLPPLAEQKRIVERLEELLPLCDRLKEKFSLM